MAGREAQTILANFPSFYESWLSAQQSFRQQLIHSLQQTQGEDKEQTQQRLISEVLSHYQRYYEQISMAASEDIFQVFSAPWLTSFERTLLWISGFRPSIIFRLLSASVHDLTPLQAAAVEDFTLEVKRQEQALTEAMTRLQETIASPPILNLVRRAGTRRLVDGEVDEMDTAIEELRMGILGVFDRADLLRGSTVIQLIRILNSDQTVRLLTATTDFQLRVRRWGLSRNSPPTTTTTTPTPTP